MGNDSPFKRAEIDAGSNRVVTAHSSAPCNTNVGCSASTSTVNIISSNPSSNSISNSNKPLDLSNNPYLNGNYMANRPQVQVQHQHQQQQQRQPVAAAPIQHDYSHNPFISGGNHHQKQSHVVSNSVVNGNKGAAYAGINSVNSFVSGSHNGNNLGNGLLYVVQC